MQAVILIGIPGAGKTTFYLDRFASTHVRISLDVLESRAKEMAAIAACIATRRDFVVDNTNVLRRDRARYICLAREAGFSVVGFFFKPTLRGSIGRNNHRTDKKPLPVPAVIAAYKRIEAPEPAEGFDELFLVEPAAERSFVVTRFASS